MNAAIGKGEAVGRLGLDDALALAEAGVEVLPGGNVSLVPRGAEEAVFDESGAVVATKPGAVWNPNLQHDFNVIVCDSFDARLSPVLRELDESVRFVQNSAESTSI